MHTTPRRLWQLAGALALTHVVLIPVALAIEAPPLMSDGTDGIRSSYVDGSLARTFAGGILEAFGFLLLLPALVFLSRELGRSSAAGRWAAQTGLVCGVGYVAVTFGVGFPAGAASMYGAQHGLDLDVALALNNLRNLAYFLSLMLLAGSTLGIALSALADGFHPAWFGRFGIVTAAALLAATPLAAVGLQDWGTLLWMAWFVGVGVLMLRHQRTESLLSATAPVELGHP